MRGANIHVELQDTIVEGVRRMLATQSRYNDTCIASYIDMAMHRNVQAARSTICHSHIGKRTKASGAIEPRSWLEQCSGTVAFVRVRTQMAKVLSLPGTQSVDDARLLLTADLFIMTDDVATEKVINGVVTNAVTSWISDKDHLRQVELLPWIAKELSGWDYFAPQPRGTTEPKQVRLQPGTVPAMAPRCRQMSFYTRGCRNNRHIVHNKAALRVVCRHLETRMRQLCVALSSHGTGHRSSQLSCG